MSASGFDQVAKTHVGCRRKLNEDALLANPERHLWAVADGMGGHDAGEVASATVVEALAKCASAEEALTALCDVNARLVEMAKTSFDSRTVGSTVVGIVAGENEFTGFWAGDSRAYRVRDGAIARLTRDHSLVQDLIDAGMLDESLAILAAAWSGEPVEHRGAHYTIDGIRFLPRPAQEPGVPVWVAAFPGNRRPLRLTQRPSEWTFSTAIPFGKRP